MLKHIVGRQITASFSIIDDNPPDYERCTCMAGGAESIGPCVYLRIVAVSGVRRDQIWLLVNLESSGDQIKQIRRPTWVKKSEELSKNFHRSRCTKSFGSGFFCPLLSRDCRLSRRVSSRVQNCSSPSVGFWEERFLLVSKISSEPCRQLQ